MNILFICYKPPNPFGGWTLRHFYLIKFLSRKSNNKFTLMSLIQNKNDEKNLLKLKRYFEEVISFKAPNINFNRELIYYSTVNTLSPTNMFSRSGMFEPFTIFFSNKMQKKIDQQLIDKKYDIIFTDTYSARYVAKASYPKIVDAIDALSEEWKQRAKKQNQLKNKIFWYSLYLKAIYRERNIYDKFDRCIVVTE